MSDIVDHRSERVNVTELKIGDYFIRRGNLCQVVERIFLTNNNMKVTSFDKVGKILFNLEGDADDDLMVVPVKVECHIYSK